MQSPRMDLSHPWRWMILLSRFAWTFISLGNFKSMGVFLPHFMASFSASTVSAGAVGTVIISVGGVSGPFAGALMTVLDARKLTMLGGTLAASSLLVASFSTSIAQLALWFALSSIGLSWIQVSTVKPLMDYFPADFAAANGVSLSGGTVGIMVLPVVMEYLVSVYGWRRALGLMGAFSFNYVVCGALLRPLKYYTRVPSGSDSESTHLAPRNEKTKLQNDDEKPRNFVRVCKKVLRIITEQFDTSLMTQGKFVIYQVVTLLCGIIFGSWHLYLIPQGLELGYGDAPAALLATFGGVGALIGRLGHGTLVDRGFVKVPTLFIAACLTFGVSCLVEPLAVSSYATLAAFSTVSGLAMGAIYPLTFVLVREATGDERMLAFGWLYLFQSTGQILGGLISGWIHDVSGSYESVFFTTGGVAVTMGAILVLTQFMENCCVAKH